MKVLLGNINARLTANAPDIALTSDGRLCVYLRVCMYVCISPNIHTFPIIPPFPGETLVVKVPGDVAHHHDLLRQNLTKRLQEVGQ